MENFARESRVCLPFRMKHTEQIKYERVDNERQRGNSPLAHNENLEPDLIKRKISCSLRVSPATWFNTAGSVFALPPFRFDLYRAPPEPISIWIMYWPSAFCIANSAPTQPLRYAGFNPRAFNTLSPLIRAKFHTTRLNFAAQELPQGLQIWI